MHDMKRKLLCKWVCRNARLQVSQIGANPRGTVNGAFYRQTCKKEVQTNRPRRS